MFSELSIFVISCQFDTERRELTEKRLKEQNLSFQFFDAYDGHFLPEYIFVNENILLDSAGGRGCALSHKMLWKKMVEEDIDCAVIFEDDVVFSEHFRYFIDRVWQQSPKDSIQFLGHCCWQIQNTKLGWYEGFPLTTHAYVIHKNVAKWLLENFGTCVENFDIHLQKLYYDKTLSENRFWYSYVLWNGAFKSPLQGPTKWNVYFSGLVYQDHDMQLSIHRNRA